MVGGQISSARRLEGELQMALIITSVFAVDKLLWIAAASFSMPRRSPLCFCLSGRLPKISNAADPDSFQITVSESGLGLCKIWGTFFKGRISVSCSPLALQYVSPAGVHKARCSEYSSFQCEIPELGAPVQVSEPLLLEENIYNCCYPFVCGSSTCGCGSWLYCVSISITISS